jgi:Tfp pilus assembly protein PilE
MKKKFTLVSVPTLLTILFIGVIAFFAMFFGVFYLAYQSNQREENRRDAHANIRKINSLQRNYATNHNGKFAKDFDELIKSNGLDEKFNGQKPVVNGYVFEMKIIEGSADNIVSYSINADPQIDSGIQATGNWHYYSDSGSFQVKFTEEKRQANALDEIIRGRIQPF